MSHIFSVNFVVGVLVFLLVAFRHLVPFKLQYWHIMLAGSLLILLGGGLSAGEAIKAIDKDVLISLFGMFSIGHALEESGYLGHIIYKYLKRSKNISELMFLLVFIFGFASGILMNDTIAIIGVPVILLISRNYGVDLKFLSLVLAFSVTTGSVLSPLGNPQNILIALSPAFKNPFVEFFNFLLLPTLLNLGVLYFYMKVLFREEFHSSPLTHSQEPIRDSKLKKLCKYSLVIFIALIVYKIVEYFLGLRFEIKISMIPFLSALPLFIVSPKRIKILKGVDYGTLLFFMGMFIVTEALTREPVFSKLLESSKYNPSGLPAVILNSLFLSQIISNVPLTVFYLKILNLARVSIFQYIALAFASTIAGNLTILGAASNVIIIQNLERRAKKNVVHFFQFARYGIPLTVIQVGVFVLCFLFYRLIGWV